MNLSSGSGNVTLNAAALGTSSGSPSTITATAGTPQSTTINTAFATALQATVRDASSNPVSGVTVTFTAPGSGASANFSGSLTATATTNSSGAATAPTLTANGTTGNYTVAASVSGIPTPANFNLSNTTANTLQLSSATYSVTENGGSVTITVTRTGGSAGAVGVTLATSPGTATAGGDYTAVNQT